MLLPACLQPATAVLDCIGDAAWPGRASASARVLELGAPRKIVAIQFRSTSLKGWRATGAKLVVHLERGRCDGVLMAAYAAKFDEKARSLPRPTAPAVQAACSEAGAGWWQIDLPAALAQRLVDEPNGAIVLSRTGKAPMLLHSRETLSFAPRLVVEGLAP